jgi:hypothetical protein
MVAMAIRGFPLLIARARDLLPVVLSLALFLVVVAALASTYVGDARGLKNTCYGTNGRAISCSVLEEALR